MGATALLTERGRPGRRARSGWGFRTVQLNAAGAAAVLAPGVLAGASLGLLTAARTMTSPARGITRVLVLGVGGALTGLIIARVADEHRWRGMMTSWRLDEPDEALDLLQAIRAAGVSADMVRADMVRADVDAPTDVGGYALRYHVRDDRRVRAVMAARA